MSCGIVALPAIASPAIALLLLPSSHYSCCPIRVAPAGVRCSNLRACADESGTAQAGDDWRELRARLVARERGAASGTTADSTSFVYESPLIEKGAVLLDATPQMTQVRHESQPYFHKSSMLLLEHVEGENGFTLALILNRPTALRIDGWRLWYGGPVGEGGLFHPEDDAHPEPRQIICLHLREELSWLSFDVIRGVWYTTFEAAQELVSSGSADKGDFWTFVGYAGWGPDQLKEEMEGGSWALASADSSLRQILTLQDAELPPSADWTNAGDGAVPQGVETIRNRVISCGCPHDGTPYSDHSHPLSHPLSFTILIRDRGRHTHMGDAYEVDRARRGGGALGGRRIRRAPPELDPVMPAATYSEPMMGTCCTWTKNRTRHACWSAL
eukprot:6626856-Prymnesium_polylepis.1